MNPSTACNSADTRTCRRSSLRTRSAARRRRSSIGDIDRDIRRGGVVLVGDRYMQHATFVEQQLYHHARNNFENKMRI